MTRLGLGSSCSGFGRFQIKKNDTGLLLGERQKDLKQKILVHIQTLNG